jgi:hypothetical protein
MWKENSENVPKLINSLDDIVTFVTQITAHVPKNNYCGSTINAKCVWFPMQKSTDVNI